MIMTISLVAFGLLVGLLVWLVWPSRPNKVIRTTLSQEIRQRAKERARRKRLLNPRKSKKNLGKKKRDKRISKY